MVPGKSETPRKSIKKSAEKKKSARKKPSAAVTDKAEKAKSKISAELRYRMIAESAYYIAEKAGFNGDNVKYWLAAEKEIDEKFSQ